MLRVARLAAPVASFGGRADGEGRERATVLYAIGRGGGASARQLRTSVQQREERAVTSENVRVGVGGASEARNLSSAIKMHVGQIAGGLLLVFCQAVSSLVPTAAATVSILETQSRNGAPLDVLLQRHVRANDLSQPERMQLSRRLFSIARETARLDARLLNAGVMEPSPRARVLAHQELSSSEVDALEPTAAELQWLSALGPAPLETEDMPLSARLECPDWAWSGMQAAFGESVEAELRALQKPAPLSLRVNTLKATRAEALTALNDAGFTASPTRFSPLGIVLEERDVALGRLPGLLEGVVEPQDEGSTLVALLLGAQPGERVVDYCAGSGGKSLVLGAEMGNKGRVLAMDIEASRLERSAPRLRKAGIDNVETHLIDPGPTDKWLKRRKRSFDRVLVDAPCSGVGAWRRNPDARWLRKTRPLDSLLIVQADVLQRAARLVRPGGVLVYATCSLLPEENEAQVEAFLASNDGKDFALTPPDNFCAPLDASGRFMRLTPHQHGCDGFFGAVLTRNPDGWSRPQRRRPNSKGGDKGGDKGGNKGGDKGGKQAKGSRPRAATPKMMTLLEDSSQTSAEADSANPASGARDGARDGAREAAFAAMAAREWGEVDAAIAAAVRGDAALPGDDAEVKTGRPAGATSNSAADANAAANAAADAASNSAADADADADTDTSPVDARAGTYHPYTWELTVAYYGPAFSGFAWQKNAEKPTVQGCLQEALLPLLAGRSALRLECSGRTDAGVSAVGQRVSFHAWPELEVRQLEAAVAAVAPAPGSLRLVRARHRDESYHATFSTAWRRYAYLLPRVAAAPAEAVEAEAARLDALLQPLAGELRDYAALGRGVPAGKETRMRLRHAAARAVPLAGGAGAFATRIDLIGDRFLRRQVRTLVSTVVAAADAGDSADDLLGVVTSGDQVRTAHPAPALGLCFAEAGMADELDITWAGAAEELTEAELDGLRLMGSEYTEWFWP